MAPTAPPSASASCATIEKSPSTPRPPTTTIRASSKLGPASGGGTTRETRSTARAAGESSTGLGLSIAHEIIRLHAGHIGAVNGDGRLVIEPMTRPAYTLDELLAQCDASAEVSTEDRDWLDGTPVGNELL